MIVIYSITVSPPVAGASVFEVSLQAEGQLEEPGPLVLHGRHVRLDHLAGRVVPDDQALAAVQHRAELGLPLLQL